MKPNYICRFATSLSALLLLCTGNCLLCAADAVSANPNSTSQESAVNEVKLFDGKTLQGWAVVDAADFNEHGTVEAVDGQILIAAGEPGSGITWEGELPKINYEIRLKAKRIEGRDFFCGMTFPIRDEFCTWIVGGWGGGVIGISNINGSSAVENETTSYKEFELNRWYDLRLEVTETSLRAWIDDEKVVDVPADERSFSVWLNQSPMKPLGIATWRTSSALKEITLRKLDVKKAPSP